MSRGPRARAIEEYKREKKGWYGVVDPGPRVELLKEIGIDLPKRPTQYVMAPAVAQDARGTASGGNNRRSRKLIGRMLTDRTNGSTSEGPTPDSEPSEGTDACPAQAWAAAAAKRRVPRMPLQSQTAGSHQAHRQKECPPLCHNPFTDAVLECDVEDPFGLPREWREAAVARPVTKDEARRNQDAQDALDKEWKRLREIQTWKEDEVEEWSKVRARFAKQDVKNHIGRLFSILVEKR